MELLETSVNQEQVQKYKSVVLTKCTVCDLDILSCINICILVDCDPGYKISGESCEPCGFGFYNSKRHQTECLKCTTKDTNTSTETSTNATDCQCKYT